MNRVQRIMAKPAPLFTQPKVFNYDRSHFFYALEDRTNPKSRVWYLEVDEGTGGGWILRNTDSEVYDRDRFLTALAERNNIKLTGY